MQLTILGSSASFAGAGQACAGYLVEHDGTKILIDCGNGTIANAAAVADVTAFDAVLVSHTHPDHFADLYALQAALRFAPDGPVGSVPLYLPEGLWERLGLLLSDRGREQLEAAYEPHTIESGQTMVFGGITVIPHAVDHEGPTYAFTVDAGGVRLVYTADTRLGEQVREAAAGCDVLLAECTLPEEYIGRAPHMTASEVGGLAAEVGAGLLILTHLWPSANHDAMLEIARREFTGEVRLAEELMSIEIAASEEELS